MQPNTFTDKIDGCDIEFTLNRLKFRKTEQVLGLISDFRELTEPKKQVAAIREAVSICLAGWSLDRPISDWDEEIEISDAVKLVSCCLRGNSANEGDKKK